MSDTIDPGTEVPTPPTQPPTPDMHHTVHVLTGTDWTPPPPVIASTVEPKPSAPVVDDEPHVSQTAKTLSCTMGNWFYNPDYYAYQWHRDGIAVGSGASYPIVSEDVGHDFTCVVTASNERGASSAISNTITAF